MKNFNKMMIQRPLVNQLVRRLEQLLRKFKQVDLKTVGEYELKYAALFEQQFKQHTRFDGEY